MEKEDSDNLKVRSTRKLYIPIYFMVIVLIVFLIYVKANDRYLDVNGLRVAILFILGTLIFSEVHRYGNSYEINSSSFIHKKGYLTTTSKRVEFGAISDSDMRQTLWQRLFSYGDVEIHRFSEISVIKNINQPVEFLNFLEKKMTKGGGR
jgi:membrane protein YdbS with pleckstrin-like domain